MSGKGVNAESLVTISLGMTGIMFRRKAGLSGTCRLGHFMLGRLYEHEARQMSAPDNERAEVKGVFGLSGPQQTQLAS